MLKCSCVSVLLVVWSDEFNGKNEQEVNLSFSVTT